MRYGVGSEIYDAGYKETKSMVLPMRGYACFAFTHSSKSSKAECVKFKFCETSETEDWVESVVWRMTIRKGPYEHHIHRGRAAA